LNILISASAKGAPSSVTLPFSISFPSCAVAAKPKRTKDSMRRCFTNEREMSAKRTNLLNIIRLKNSAGKVNKWISDLFYAQTSTNDVGRLVADYAVFV
jgi:hypothetical protein